MIIVAIIEYTRWDPVDAYVRMQYSKYREYQYKNNRDLLLDLSPICPPKVIVFVLLFSILTGRIVRQDLTEISIDIY